MEDTYSINTGTWSSNPFASSSPRPASSTLSHLQQQYIHHQIPSAPAMSNNPFVQFSSNPQTPAGQWQSTCTPEQPMSMNTGTIRDMYAQVQHGGAAMYMPGVAQERQPVHLLGAVATQRDCYGPQSAAHGPTGPVSGHRALQPQHAVSGSSPTYGQKSQQRWPMSPASAPASRGEAAGVPQQPHQLQQHSPGRLLSPVQPDCITYPAPGSLYNPYNPTLHVQLLSRGVSDASAGLAPALPEVASPPCTPDSAASINTLQQHWQQVQQQQQMMQQSQQTAMGSGTATRYGRGYHSSPLRSVNAPYDYQSPSGHSGSERKALPRAVMPAGVQGPANRASFSPTGNIQHSTAPEPQQQPTSEPGLQQPWVFLGGQSASGGPLEAVWPSSITQAAVIPAASAGQLSGRYSPRPAAQVEAHQPLQQDDVLRQTQMMLQQLQQTDVQAPAQQLPPGAASGIGSPQNTAASPGQHVTLAGAQKAADEYPASSKTPFIDAAAAAAADAAAQERRSGYLDYPGGHRGLLGPQDPGVRGSDSGSSIMPATPFAVAAQGAFNYQGNSSAGVASQSAFGNAAVTWPAIRQQQESAGYGVIDPATAAARLQLVQQQQQQQEQSGGQPEPAVAFALQQQLASVTGQAPSPVQMGGAMSSISSYSDSRLVSYPYAAVGGASTLTGMVPMMVPAMYATPATFLHPLQAPGPFIGQVPVPMAAAVAAAVQGYGGWFDPRIMQAAAAAVASGYGPYPASAIPTASTGGWSEGTAAPNGQGIVYQGSNAGTVDSVSRRHSADDLQLAAGRTYSSSANEAVACRSSADALLASTPSLYPDSRRSSYFSGYHQQGSWDAAGTLPFPLNMANWILGGLFAGNHRAAQGHSTAASGTAHPTTTAGAGPFAVVRSTGQGLAVRAADTAVQSVMFVGNSSAAVVQTMVMALVWYGHYQLVLVLYILLGMTATVVAMQRAVWGAGSLAVNTAMLLTGFTIREARLFTSAAAKVAWSDIQQLPVQLLDQPWLQLQQQSKGKTASAVVLQQLPAPESLQHKGLLGSVRDLLLLGSGSCNASSAVECLTAPAAGEEAAAAVNHAPAASKPTVKSWFGSSTSTSSSRSTSMQSLPDAGVAVAASDTARSSLGLSRMGSSAPSAFNPNGMVVPSGKQPNLGPLVIADSLSVISGMWVGLGLKLWGLATIRVPYETARVWSSAAWYGARMGWALSRAAGYYVFQLIWCIVHMSLIIAAHARSHLQLPYGTALAAVGPVVQRAYMIGCQAVLLVWKHLGRSLLAAAGSQLYAAAEAVPGGLLGLQLLQAAFSIWGSAVYAALHGAGSAAHWLLTADVDTLQGVSIQQVLLQGLGVTVSAAVWFSRQAFAQAERLLAVLATRVLHDAPPVAQAAVWGSASMLKRLVMEVSQQSWLLVAQMYHAWILQQQQNVV